MFQCDLDPSLQIFKGEYCCFLNSKDLHDDDLALTSYRSHGGTMILWRKDLDPFIKVHRVTTSSFLPIVFDPPHLPPTIHIAVYLRTLGKESDFLDEFANLDNCIDELKEVYSDAHIYLRGDFNVSKSNQNRTSILNQFCSRHNSSQVEIHHPSYHHFTGSGASDSHLDRLLYPCSAHHLEVLMTIYCRNDEPLLNSRHDLIVSKFSLNPLKNIPPCSTSANLTASHVVNARTKTVWSETGIAHYQEIVQPHFRRIRELWLNSSSKASMSLLLQATNDIMSSSSALTNQSISLNTPVQEKSKRIPKAIKRSQASLLRINRKVLNHTGPPESLLSPSKT